MVKSLKEKFEAFFYKGIVRKLIFSSKLGRRVMFGYADTGTSFDHIYKNEAKGYTKFGKIVDRVLLNLPAAKATRHRRNQIKKLLYVELAKNTKEGLKTRLVDIASGPARYLVEMASNEVSKNIEVLCLDADLNSINYGRKLSAGKPFLYKKTNVLRLGSRHENLANQKGWRPNVAVSSGLIEYLDEQIAKQLLKYLYSFLDGNGLLLMITQRASPNRNLIEQVGITQSGKKWILFYREPAVIVDWLTQIGFKNITFEVDPWKMYVYYRARKQ
ncbi:MAG: class I SAM-dependent methyltransferase family protein [Candidatus Omnitrophica bacterium]|nr:class I SAM-dependent methyltransferase family protein [Candidatus Omnitrophota bacterium]